MTEIYRAPFFQPVSVTGAPLAGALLYFYTTGTTTPITTYQDSTLSTPSTTVVQSDGSSAIVADASGIFAPIYVGIASYKTVLKTAALVTVQTVDPVLATTGIADFHAATSKTTPVTADEIPLLDSAASYVLKKLTWGNLVATLSAAFGGIIAALTGKTTPVDADMLVIADSAASNASKKLTWANLKATLLSTWTATNADVWTGTATGVFVPPSVAISSGAEQALVDGATITIDFSVGVNFSVTLGGNRTLAASNLTNLVGRSGYIKFTQDGTGSRTINVSGGSWVNGSAIALSSTPAAVDYVYYQIVSASTVRLWTTTGSMTLLGTLTTTSGATQSLTSLTLTSYKYLLCIVKGVSQTSTGTLQIALGSGGTPTYGSTVTLTAAGTAASTFDGVVYIYGINQTNQQQMTAPALAMNGVNIDAVSSYAQFIATGTAAVCNAVRFLASAGSFDAGSIDIYGVS